jgi:hypothetical protein
MARLCCSIYDQCAHAKTGGEAASVARTNGQDLTASLLLLLRAKQSVMMSTRTVEEAIVNLCSM